MLCHVTHNEPVVSVKNRKKVVRQIFLVRLKTEATISLFYPSSALLDRVHATVRGRLDDKYV